MIGIKTKLYHRTGTIVGGATGILVALMLELNLGCYVSELCCYHHYSSTYGYSDYYCSTMWNFPEPSIWLGLSIAGFLLILLFSTFVGITSEDKKKGATIGILGVIVTLIIITFSASAEGDFIHFVMMGSFSGAITGVSICVIATRQNNHYIHKISCGGFIGAIIGEITGVICAVPLNGNILEIILELPLIFGFAVIGTGISKIIGKEAIKKKKYQQKMREYGFKLQQWKSEGYDVSELEEMMRGLR